MSDLSFFSENILFNLSNEAAVSTWIFNVIFAEKKTVGNISYVFCTDEYLHKLNLEHLNHDTYTDIITFDYCEGDLMQGDIFISIDRVKENAEKFKVSFEEELRRVLVHGVLHLVGYKDKSDEEAREMRVKEDFYLSLFDKSA